MKPRFISTYLRGVKFVPVREDGTFIEAPPIVLLPDELEAFKLVYLEGLSQEEAARRMGVSRGTLWRCLSSARRKIARMLVEMRPLVVAWGEEYGELLR
ncbi:MAG: hypothetical protein DRJ52_02200 [Thermoprotei archaeon]|nr:MAG: hypothetical protein DRJ52_02200 [Thermoprotei archaeon]RLF01144.1 MAG: hypothetical protein DRJ63_00125 [Thermoprotei archaeon]HDI75611.1 DUF134 domain-containing protein [Thermoprotei archaeon]